MRIFYASDTTPNASFVSNLWRNNLLLPLQDLGHDVVEFDYDLRETFRNLDTKNPRQAAFTERNRPKVEAALMQQLKRAHSVQPFDMFFSYFTDACITPRILEELKSLGITTVNWYCNGSYRLDLVEKIASHYDWCLVPEQFRLQDYVALGARPIYCQEAANPNIYKPYEAIYEYDVAFIGQAYGERPEYIQYLLEAGVAVHVWGFGWERYTAQQLSATSLLRGAWRRLRGVEQSLVQLPANIVGNRLSDEEMVRTYSKAKINLGFSTCGDTHQDKKRILQIRLRDFEIPMSGGFYMVEYMAELAEFFNIGEEIVCYYDRDDLVEKIKYYLVHDEERERIRQAGRRRCLADHTWQKRFQTAFASMGVGS